MQLTLKDGTEYVLPQALEAELRSVYRGISLEKEFGKMRLWCMKNPSRRKTRNGVERFIVNWLNKAQPEIAATLPRCVRCAKLAALHTHNGGSYCTPCLAAVVGTRDSEPRKIGSLLDKLVRA